MNVEATVTRTLKEPLVASLVNSAAAAGASGVALPWKLAWTTLDALGRWTKMGSTSTLGAKPCPAVGRHRYEVQVPDVEVSVQVLEGQIHGGAVVERGGCVVEAETDDDGSVHPRPLLEPSSGERARRRRDTRWW